VEELNIGHSIIARAVFSGLGEAVREMKRIINDPSL
jgi:pyridoxine 5-phosphate synthase